MELVGLFMATIKLKNQKMGTLSIIGSDNMTSDAQIDISNIEINKNESINMRYKEYINQVNDPYSYRVDNVGVTINFNGEKTLTDALCGIAKKT